VLPIDDVHSAFSSRAGEAAGDIGRMRSKMNGKFWWELSEAEHRDFPGDLRGPGQPGADRGPFGRAPAHQRPRRGPLAPLPARAAGAVARGDDPSGVARGPGAGSDAALRRLRQFSSPHEGPCC
jgi:hypothetical protein